MAKAKGSSENTTASAKRRSASKPRPGDDLMTEKLGMVRRVAKGKYAGLVDHAVNKYGWSDDDRVQFGSSGYTKKIKKGTIVFTTARPNKREIILESVEE